MVLSVNFFLIIHSGSHRQEFGTSDHRLLVREYILSLDAKDRDSGFAINLDDVKFFTGYPLNASAYYMLCLPISPMGAYTAYCIDLRQVDTPFYTILTNIQYAVVLHLKHYQKFNLHCFF